MVLYMEGVRWRGGGCGTGTGEVDSLRRLLWVKSCGGSDYRVIHGGIWLVVHFLVENPMTRCLMGREVVNW